MYGSTLDENPYRRPQVRLLVRAVFDDLERVRFGRKMERVMLDPASDAEGTEADYAELWQLGVDENLTGLGVNITYHPPTDPAWQDYWRLYCAQAFDNDPGTKLFESNYASLPIT